MAFKIGDKVVHPQYGVGHVVKLEEREFEPGLIHSYYEVSIPGGSTVWVPVDLPTTGLRKLASRSEIVQCRKILESPASPLAEDGRFRQSELAVHLKDGTIAAQCEVVRDLSSYVAHKPSSGPISAFLQATQGVLCQEWAIVEGITVAEAVVEISLLLDKSRLALSESKSA
jgi:CarD family transcriptional regulator